MNLISCDNCGVVLDAHKLNFPTLSFEQDPNIMAWDYDRRVWVPTVSCPVCESKILAPDS
jgi:hypothetical protein